MLELKNITKSYENKTILKDVNMVFPDKGFIGIKGRSGCGKSTLLYILGLLDQDYEGEMFYNGKLIEDKLDFIQQHISFVMQHNDYIGSLNVKENIMLAQIVSSKKVNLDMKILKSLGISHLLKRLPETLSGGELKRVTIAKAILKDSLIVLCDEPTGSLSLKQSKEVMELLKDLSEDRLVIIVSHSEELLDTYCDQVLLLEDCQLKGECCRYEVTRKHFYEKKTSFLYFYPIREIIKQKYKYIFFFLFQWVICLCFILMNTSMNGFNDYFETLYEHQPHSHLIYVENKNHTPFQSFDNFKNYKYKDYDYDLSSLKINKLKEHHLSFLPKNTDHITLMSGQLPKKGEILISESIQKEYKEDFITIQYPNKNVDYKISGVVLDSDFSSQDIYLSYDEKETHKEYVNPYVIVLEVEQTHLKETLDSLNKNYISSSDNLMLKDSYLSLIQSARIVAYIFMIMNMIISAILIKIVLTIVYHQRKHDIAYLYSLGMEKKRMKTLFVFETIVLSLVLIIGSISLSQYVIHFINELGVLNQMFHIHLILKKIVFTSYDIYIIIAFVYIMTFLLCSFIPIKEALNQNYIDILRGE